MLNWVLGSTTAHPKAARPTGADQRSQGVVVREGRYYLCNLSCNLQCHIGRSLQKTESINSVSSPQEIIGRYNTRIARAGFVFDKDTGQMCYVRAGSNG
jgi:hypothetical protein